MSLELETDVPAGFVEFLPRSGYTEHNRPLYFSRAESGLTLGFTVRHRHCNPAGQCHGGVLMAFADQVLALNTMLLMDRKKLISSITLSHDFLAFAGLGEWIYGTAELLTQTGSLAFSQGVVRTRDRLIARFSGVYRIGPEASPVFDLNAILDECEQAWKDN